MLPRAAAVLVVCLAGCGAVPAETIIDATATDAGAEVDGPTDAARCPRDVFDGTMLASHWVTGRIGSAPTYFMEDGWLRLRDAAVQPFVADLDMDRGNQMAWAVPVDGRDFTVAAKVSWRSESTAVWLAGIGVTGATDLIEALAGFEDPSVASAGRRFARIRNPAGADEVWTGETATAATTAGSAELVVRRRAGSLTMTIDGDQALARDVLTPIERVVIVSLRHRNSANEYPFGQFGIDEIAVTLGGCEP